MLLTATYNCNEDSDVRLLSFAIYLRYLIELSSRISISIGSYVLPLSAKVKFKLYIMPYDALHFDY